MGLQNTWDPFVLILHGFPVTEHFNQIDNSIDDICVNGCKMSNDSNTAQIRHIEH